MRRLLTLTVLSCLMATDLLASDLSFSIESVAAHGFTPGTPVVWFGAAIESTGYEIRARRINALATADATGTVVHEVDGGIVARSVWIAVDLTSGRYATGIPVGSPGNVKHVAETDYLTNLRLLWPPNRAISVDVLLARPGGGAWTSTAADGGRDDHDARLDGRILFVPASFKSVSNAGLPPTAFVPGDLIVAVHPFELEMFIVEVTR